MPPYTRHSILNNLDIKTVEKSTRFISQGDKTDHAYIIKKGSCIVLVEKNEKLHPVDHKSEGDMLLMPALFTGEPVNSHIEAETDMELWVLKKSIFEKISKNDPGLWEFLIEIIAAKFDSKRPISDRTIGPYIATDIIGRGGYSIVYKGINSSTNQDIAIKMMRHHIVVNPDFLEKFRNEAKIVTKFNHENIIKIFDRVERFQTVFIIMEYLEGKSIKELLVQKKRILPNDAVKFLIQICKAIDYAYQQDILHKDINTENIMIVNNDQAKLLDFGLACSIYEEDDLFDGALAYLAPEISQGEIANLQSEIYSLGITAFEMVTGKRPYPETNQAVFTKIRCENEIPDPKNFVPDLPDSLHRFIIKACRLDPEKRYASMKQAIKDLMEL